MESMFFYRTDIGKIGIAESYNAVTNVYLREEDVPEVAVVRETPLLKEAGEQLQEYFIGKRVEFALPLKPEGTKFMHQAWEALYTIPYGETRSYREIAEYIGNRNAARAVGLANNRNPIPIFIPCHRVIGTNGKLTGYRGGLEIKERLLELERQHAYL